MPSIKSILLFLLFTIPAMGFTCLGQSKKLTGSSVIEQIKKESGITWWSQTVDTFKAGDPNAEITGVATTFLATLDVLKAAKAKGLNLIITHEPTFYNHQDDESILEGDVIQAEKRKYIEKNGLIVWRFHDHIHQMKPDGIMEGMTQKMGWQHNRVPNNPGVFQFEEMTLNAFADQLSTHSPNPIRIIGNPDMRFTNVGAVWGAAPSIMQINALQNDQVEVLVIGETREWETVEYVRDAVAMGKKKALVIIGHANSEEAGMIYCANWLKTFVKVVPIEFIEAGDPFWTPEKN